MISVYVNMIVKGVIQLEDVPDACQEDVRHALDQG